MMMAMTIAAVPSRTRTLLAAGAALTAAAGLVGVAAAAPAGAFGTTASQGAEHERITRLALACPAGVPSDGSCFEPVSLDQLAGRTGTFGAIGAPDVDEILTPAAHCDDADYLNVSGYSRSRAQATAQLQACITHLRTRFGQAVSTAGAVLNSDGSISSGDVDLSIDCTFVGGVPGRAKCNSIEGFGRALHGIQDFYSHSNWTDQAGSGSISRTNPPGLNQSAPSALLDLRGTGFAAVPTDLSTGYYSTAETIFGCSTMAGLTGRVTHKCLNKDLETIDLATGAVSSPRTDRGKIGSNAAKAVAGAIIETRRQWADLRAQLLATYGPADGAAIVHALTSDAP
jgi:hypothetical protein